MTTDLILGTAGHIDHGKTSLIRALTGVDTDRLPEEKRRGITIELGFAQLNVGDFRLGVVDVPGHERFVRNMLIGATGMDVALLVVAADDSIKPQTREHLDILRLLDLEAGVIALTKCDLVEPDWLELVEDEIRGIVDGTFLAQAPLIRTSATTGHGLDSLKRALEEAAQRAAVVAEPRSQGPFRMAIDRTFTIAGHGTVVTGSVSRGRASLGDQLLLQPGNVSVRVRGIQNHEAATEQIVRGQRAAINLAGVHHEQVVRGQELTSPGYLVPTRLITANVGLLDDAPRPLKNRARVRMHVGAAELLASVVLLDRDVLQAGESASAQLFLSAETVVTWNQPFVLRSESPVSTIGGGRVLDPNSQKLRKPTSRQLQMVTDLGHDEPLQRANAALYLAGLRDWHSLDLVRTAGVENYEELSQQLADREDLVRLQVSPTRTLALHRLVLEELCDRVAAALKLMHERNPLRSILDRSQLANAFRYLGADDVVFNKILQMMQADKRIRLTPDGVALVGQGPKLSQNERKLLEQLVRQFRDAGIQSPTVKECQQNATKNQSSVPQLLELAVANGQLIEVARDYYLHSEVAAELKDTLRERMRNGDGMTMSEIRETLETTRKFAVPFCEYLDRIEFTRREGDLRVLAAGTA